MQSDNQRQRQLSFTTYRQIGRHIDVSMKTIDFDRLTVIFYFLFELIGETDFGRRDSQLTQSFLSFTYSFSCQFMDNFLPVDLAVDRFQPYRISKQEESNQWKKIPNYCIPSFIIHRQREKRGREKKNGNHLSFIDTILSQMITTE